MLTQRRLCLRSVFRAYYLFYSQGVEQGAVVGKGHKIVVHQKDGNVGKGDPHDQENTFLDTGNQGNQKAMRISLSIS